MKAKATGPGLFGKRMQESQEGWEFLYGLMFVRVVRRDSGWNFRVAVDHLLARGSRVSRKSPQAAANDAERFLRKLKRELERMGA
jgi:hypothetical protein